MFAKIQKYFVIHKLEIVGLLLILLVSAFLRLYNISDYMTFLGDEGRDAIVAREILQGNFTLLGPRASAGDFFLGPIYYYMMAPFLLLSNYDPVGPAIMVALFGIATVFLIYYVGKSFFGTISGLLAALLYAVSPVVIAYSRSSWNPNPMPFFSLLMLYLVYLGVKKQAAKLFVITGILLGIAMQLHYLSTFLTIIIFFFVLIGDFLIKDSRKIRRVTTHYLSIFAGFLVGLAPFLLFEIRHGFPNLRTILNFVIEGNQENTTPNYSFSGNIWNVFFRLFGRLVTKYPPPEQINVSESFVLQLWMMATILLAIASIAILYRAKDKLAILLLSLWLLFGIVLFGFYSKSIYDYYLGFLFPLPFLLVGNLLSTLTKSGLPKGIGVAIASTILIFLLGLNISGNPFRYTANKQKDQAKTISEFVLSKTDAKPFNFALLTRGNSDHVYRYFFDTANRTPTVIENPLVDPRRKSVTDQLLIVCEYQECEPLGNSLWEVAGFGRAEIAGEWNISFVKIYRLIHYERPADFNLRKVMDTGKSEFRDGRLNISFSYPESFVVQLDESTSGYPIKPLFNLYLTTPDVQIEERRKIGFDINKYTTNTMRVWLLMFQNDENMSLDKFLETFYGESIHGKTPTIDLLKQGLVGTNIPKENSYVYNGSLGEWQSKRYYFQSQNKIYALTLFGGVDTGDNYSKEAEIIFDEIVKSIKFY